jgi:DNA-binding response OmpR family regulator
MVTERILVADDEAEIRNLLAKYLEREGFTVDLASGGRQALSFAASRAYDLVLLDLMMPDIDGYEVCRQIRASSEMPILILSAKDDESDKVSGLMLGADDYITKPFSANELVARVRAHLRRANAFRDSGGKQNGRNAGALNAGAVNAPGHGVIDLLGISVDIDKHTVRKNGTEINLTPKEFDLLVLLMSSPGQVFTKSRIFRAVWGDFAVEDENTVMVHVRRLRLRIEDDPSNPVLVKTVHGIGYNFAES